MLTTHRLRIIACLLALCLSSPGWSQDSVKTGTVLRIMTFNAWGAGRNAGKPVDETVAAIRAAGADIIGIQEMRAEADDCSAEVCPPGGGQPATAEIARALGFNYMDQPSDDVALWANAVISRYPIETLSPHGLGARIDVNGQKVVIFNIHLTDYPFQPYQALDIPYGEAPFLHTAPELAEAAVKARGDAIQELKNEMEFADGAVATFVTGDFNEPSWRDWTDRAVAAGHQPLAVRFPSALAVEDMGFIDSYRAIRSDEVALPGLTWTPTTADDDPADHHDRIDYIFVRGKGVNIFNAQIVGEDSAHADIVSTPWPSDHRAVVTTVQLPE